MEKKTKSFILRVDSDTMDAIEAWAADEFRSTNGQLQWIITEALRKAKRLPKRKLLSVILAIGLPLWMHAQGIIGTWKGELNTTMFKLPLVLHVAADSTCTLDSPHQHAKDIPAKQLYRSDDSLSISCPAINATYTARLQGDTLRGTFVQHGQPLKLSLIRGAYEARRPQTPQPPFPYTIEEVQFVNAEAGATLSGTLSLPANVKRPPVVLMVTGSGQQNRDEELFLHRPFAVLADYLARHGIASLRYDDRGFGQSKGGEVAKATTKDFADDAQAGIEWLRRSDRFSQVGLLGHSEGGAIGFILGSKQQLDFIVSLAGPALKGDTLLLLQQKAALGPLGGFTTLESLRINILLRGNPWLSYYIDYDPQADIASITCPVFALNGSKDIQVLSTPNLEAIQHTLPPSKHHLTKEYPGLNHLFQHCTTGHPKEYGTIEETISEEVLQDITNWILTINRQKKHFISHQ